MAERMNKDRLFHEHNSAPNSFTFNDKVAEVFDDMLARSVPNYHQVIAMTGDLLKKFLKEGDIVCDLGCSTGQALITLAQQLRPQKLCFLGLDNSPAMLKKARLKAELYSLKKTIDFQLADIISAELPSCGAFTLNYTMQFLRPLQRQDFLKKIYTALRPGGVLIMAEKTISSHTAINEAFIELYHNFKRDQGYSELEIARKRESLENILIPFSIPENLDLLADAGFSHIEPFCQWYNFIAIIALKEPT